MSEIKGLLKEEMPREKLILNGPSNLTEIELLAIILRVGTKNKNVIELSREILSKFRNNIICRKSYEELLEFNGISIAKACQIVSVFELSRRLSIKEIKKNIFLNSSKEIYEYINIFFTNLQIEKIMIILVDSKNKLIRKEFIFEGTLNYSLIDSREIIKKCLTYNASGFFLVHNHPSGNSSPSNEDIEITKKIKEITDKINIRFLDHLIIGDSYYSMFDNEII